MSKFKYEIFQAVTVPHHPGRQGIVVAQFAHLSAEPEYDISFLRVTKVDGLERVLQVTDRFSESTIEAVQPPKMLTQLEADRLANAARGEVTAEFNNQIAAMRKQIAHLDRSARRRVSRKRR